MYVCRCPDGSGDDWYAFVTNFTELILLSTVQGLAFGIGTTAGITLAIDITNSTLRSAGNVSFSWTARLGMLLGIILGVWLYQSHSFQNLLTVSVITGAVGILMLSGVYVPFRAPIVTKLYSFDRFLLLRGWVPAINLTLITFVPGLLIPMVHPFLNDFVLGNGNPPYPILCRHNPPDYIISLFIAPCSFLKRRHCAWSYRIGLKWCMSLLNTDLSIGISSVLLGLGLGLTMPEFLMICETIHHCQRNSQHYPFVGKRSWYLLGIATACYMELDTDKDAPYRTDGSFYRLFAVLRIGHLSLLYKEEGKDKIDRRTKEHISGVMIVFDFHHTYPKICSFVLLS